MTILGGLAVWLGCIISYLSSTRQQLLNKALPKLPVWVVAVLLCGVAAFLLAPSYGAVTAGLTVLMWVMCLWVAFVFLGAWLSKQWALVSFVSLGAVASIALAGG